MNKIFARHLWLKVLSLIGFTFFNIDILAQCNFSANSGAVNLGSIIPTTTWQTTGCVTGGDYYTFTATLGQAYIFTFCENGGSASWDTELSINTSAGSVVAGAYNDDFCGIQSQLTWTATSNGTFAIYVTGFGCTNNANCTTLAYRVTPPTALTVQTGGNYSNASWLVENVFLSGCSQVSGVTFTGNSQAIGHFTNGASIGISEGIIIASGAATNAQGPNNSTGVTSAFGTPGDANLTALTALAPCGSPAPTFDAASIQFSFVPLTNSVQFQYVFASDEYPEYVCSSFDDVFGFFITGPGLPLQNIALIPGTSTFVAINTVNAISNSSFYNDNAAGSIITQYDGYTDVMTAVATGLTPCQTYTIKLAVADAGDSILDSAVFLAASSFNAGNAVFVSSFVPSSGTQDAYEGCVDGYFEFVRGDLTELSQPIVLQITVTGTATPGSDYQTLPLTVTIPAGQISYQLPVIAYADFLAEGFESIIVQINELQCNCTFPPPAQINIYDSTEPFNAFISNPPTICPGEPVLIAVIASGSSFTPYTYLWSNGQSDPALFVSPFVTTNYSVTVTDACGRTTATAIQVNVSNTPPNATINPAGPFCSNSSPVLLTAASAGGIWSGPGVNPTTGVFNPVTAFGTGPGPYTITYTISNFCGSSTQSTQITVNPVIVPVINPIAPVCQGTVTTTTLTANVPGGIWSGPGITGGTNSSGQFSYTLAASIGASPYIITYTTPAPCGSSTTTTISVLAQATAGITPGTSICNGQNTTITASGGGSYTWNTGSSSASITVSPTNTTTYIVTVTNTAGCTATANTTITVNNISPPSLTAPSICPGQNVSLNAGSGYIQYLWSTGAASQTITVSPTVNTTYSVTVTNVAGCTASASVLVTINSGIVPPNPVSTTICSGGSATLNAGSGYATYSWSSGGSGQTVTISPASTTTYTVTVSNIQGCTSTGTATVTVLTLPNAGTITPNPAALCQGTTLQLSSSATGGFWNSSNTSVASVNSSNGLVQGIAAGTATITYTITNAQGCSAAATRIVTVHPLPNVAPISGNVLFCQGTMTTLSSATMGGTWSSSNTGVANVNSTNGMVQGIAAGTATITYSITDGNGCTGSKSTVISVLSLPSATISGTTTLCFGGSTGITFNGSSNATVFYNINGGANQSVVLNPTGTATINAGTLTSTTTYNLVSISSAGTPSCSQTLSGTATVSVLNLPVASIGNPLSAVCWGESVTFNLIGTPNAVITYNTNQNTTSQFITLNPSGNAPLDTGPLTETTDYHFFSVQLPGTLPCTSPLLDTITIVVNPLPVADIVADNEIIICAGAAAMLTATGGISYNWSNGLGTNASVSVTPDTTTTYTVTVTDNNGCSNEESIAIEVSSGISVISVTGINAPEPQITCLSETEYLISFLISGGYSPYLVNGIPVSGNIFNSNTIVTPEYDFLVTDALGCSLIVSGNNSFCQTNCTVTAIYQPVYYSDTCLDGFQIIATGGPVQPPEYLYSLNGGSFNATPVFTGLEQGTYSVQVWTGCGIQPLPNYYQPVSALDIGVIITPVDDVFTGQVVISGGNPPYSILWSTGSTGLTTFLGPLPGTGNVTVTDANGCSKLVEFTNQGVVGIPVVDTAENIFSLFPNPVVDRLTVSASYPLLQPAKLLLYSVQGQLIQQRYSNFRQPEEFDLQELPEGVYILHIVEQERQYSYRILWFGK